MNKARTSKYFFTRLLIGGARYVLEAKNTHRCIHIIAFLSIKDEFSKDKPSINFISQSKSFQTIGNGSSVSTLVNKAMPI